MTYFESRVGSLLRLISRRWRSGISEIETAMQENGSDFARLSQLQQELDEQNEKQLEKYERYEYLSELDGWKK